MDISGLKYADPTNTTIYMDVTKGSETFPFTYCPDDMAEVSVAVRELLAAGGVSIAPYEAPETPYVPIIVAASSAKLVLDDDGLYAGVAAVCLAHSVKAVRIFWESANTWAENNPYVLAIGTELGLSDEQMHEKFVRALAK